MTKLQQFWASSQKPKIMNEDQCILLYICSQYTATNENEQLCTKNQQCWAAGQKPKLINADQPTNFLQNTLQMIVCIEPGEPLRNIYANIIVNIYDNPSGM